MGSLVEARLLYVEFEFRRKEAAKGLGEGKLRKGSQGQKFEGYTILR